MSINISKSEVLRYLGYRNQLIDGIMEGLIDESIGEIKKHIEEKVIYKEFKVIRLRDGIGLEPSSLELKGTSIREHLAYSEKAILIALSLGHSVDRLIRYYERVNMAKAMVLDAAASTAIEEVADRLCKGLEEIYGKEEGFLTSRFSPGYGDLSIEIQKDLLNLLDAGRTIGLTATSSNILIPRKSVTAIVGVTDRKMEKRQKNCRDCNKYKTCSFTKGDGKCGY